MKLSTISMGDKGNFERLKKMVKGECLANDEVVELLASHDTIVKKITCSYVQERCTSQSDLCLLTTNLILRDCADANPSIRCCSISTIATIPGVEDSAIRVILTALSDQSPMVRRAATLACIKLHQKSKETFMDSGLIDSLYEGIRDNDPIVTTNCLLTLEHILKEEGGIVLNKSITHYIFSRLEEFLDCNLCYIFTLLLKYKPKSEDEVFLLLNLLDNSLSSLSPSVLLSAMKLFIHFTEEYPHLKKDLLTTVGCSICKILSHNQHETSYLLCDYLLQFKEELKLPFGSQFKYFLLRSKDPNYLKMKKLEILPYISTEENSSELITEIKPYCNDFQCYDSSIKCMSSICLFNPSAKNMIIEVLVPLLTAPSENVIASALKSFLIIGPPSPVSKEVLQSVTEAISRPVLQNTFPSLVLYIIGSMCDNIVNVVYFLEQLSGRTDSMDDKTYCLLLMTTGWVFLRRPTETLLILGDILSTAFKSSKPLVKDKAAYVYAILEKNYDNASQLLKPCFAS